MISSNKRYKRYWKTPQFWRGTCYYHQHIQREHIFYIKPLAWEQSGNLRKHGHLTECPSITYFRHHYHDQDLSVSLPLLVVSAMLRCLTFAKNLKEEQKRCQCWMPVQKKIGVGRKSVSRWSSVSRQKAVDIAIWSFWPLREYGWRSWYVRANTFVWLLPACASHTQLDIFTPQLRFTLQVSTFFFGDHLCHTWHCAFQSTWDK